MKLRGIKNKEKNDCSAGSVYEKILFKIKLVDVYLAHFRFFEQSLLH